MVQDSVTTVWRCGVGQYLVGRKFSEDKYPSYGKLSREELEDVWYQRADVNQTAETQSAKKVKWETKNWK